MSNQTARPDPLTSSPPQNLEAEQMVLGAVLIENDSLSKVAEILSPGDFYKEQHRRIFSVMLDMFGRGEAIDLITLTEALRGRTGVESSGDALYVSSLVSQVPTTANVKNHARIVREKAVQRKRQFLGCKLSEFSGDETEFSAIIGELEGTSSGPMATRQPCLVRAGDVEATPVDWLWNPYLPLGKLTILEGDPSVGKSFFAMTLAAIVSRGWAFPGPDGMPSREQRRPPAAVVYLSAEDALADTIRPRLDLAGADCDRVFLLTGIETRNAEGKMEETGVTLKDLDILEVVLKQVQPALVVIDPIQAYLGAGVDMHRANEVRPLLAGLARLAELYHCAVLVIRHLTKGQADRSMYRGLGTIDFTAAARSVLLAGREPENPTRRVLVHLKSSNAPEGPSLGYEIRIGEGFCWTGISSFTADKLLAPDLRPEDGEKAEARTEAADFLREVLKDGPVPAREIEKQAKDAGIAYRTLHRAKDVLGVKPRKGGLKGGWTWTLPEAAEDATSPNDPLRGKDVASSGDVASSAEITKMPPVLEPGIFEGCEDANLPVPLEIPEKCAPCSRAGCMLTPGMRQQCAGPFEE